VTHATKRLYYEDARRLTFEATVTRVSPDAGGRARVVLDETAFYPTSGGQPHDLGRLDGLPVVDVLDGEQIEHIVDGETPAWTGRRVRGEVDGARRRDLTQQHSGQHVLSAAFLAALNAETVSVHIGESCSMDLDLASLTNDQAARVEALANRVVFENRAVTARVVDAAEAERAGLRRPAKRTGDLRIVTIEGFDVSACGGTHVAGTSEIGPIKLLRWERRRGGVRVEFCCGMRALADYAFKHRIVQSWSRALTVSDQELDAALERLRRRADASERDVEALRARVADLEADAWLAVAEEAVVARDETGRDVDALRAAARRVQARGGMALLGASGSLVFARGSAEGPDMGALLRRVCESLGGRGGGNAAYAQGSVPPASTAEAIARARDWLRSASGGDA
jgi:alanyl-tRNA synthetase